MFIFYSFWTEDKGKDIRGRMKEQDCAKSILRDLPKVLSNYWRLPPPSLTLRHTSSPSMTFTWSISNPVKTTTSAHSQGKRLQIHLTTWTFLYITPRRTNVTLAAHSRWEASGPPNGRNTAARKTRQELKKLLKKTKREYVKGSTEATELLRLFRRKAQSDLL